MTRSLGSDASRRIAASHQSEEQRRITASLIARIGPSNVPTVALTGSTARAKRTPISDLDYHVVGRRPNVDDLPADVDVYACTADALEQKALAGDDFVQWTLRYGCILSDDGVFRRIAALIVERDIWPDGAAKLRRLPELRRLADRLIRVGDLDAAQDQVRATLTSAARAALLLRDVFPLSRRELPTQLAAAGLPGLGEALRRTIHEDLSLIDLSAALSRLGDLELPIAA